MTANQPTRAPVSQRQSGPELLLTVPEACHRLRISRWMLYRLIQRRELATVRIGSRRFIRPEAVDALIEKLSHSSEDAQA